MVPIPTITTMPVGIGARMTLGFSNCIAPYLESKPTVSKFKLHIKARPQSRHPSNKRF